MKPIGRALGSDHRGRERVLLRPQGLPGTAGRGPACPVVWEVGGAIPPPTRLELFYRHHHPDLGWRQTILAWCNRRSAPGNDLHNLQPVARPDLAPGELRWCYRLPVVLDHHTARQLLLRNQEFDDGGRKHSFDLSPVGDDKRGALRCGRLIWRGWVAHLVSTAPADCSK